MAWDKVSSMMQCMSDKDVSGRVFMSKDDILNISYDARAHNHMLMFRRKYMLLS